MDDVLSLLNFENLLALNDSRLYHIQKLKHSSCYKGVSVCIRHHYYRITLHCGLITARIRRTGSVDPSLLVLGSKNQKLI